MALDKNAAAAAAKAEEMRAKLNAANNKGKKPKVDALAEARHRAANSSSPLIGTGSKSAPKVGSTGGSSSSGRTKSNFTSFKITKK